MNRTILALATAIALASCTRGPAGAAPTSASNPPPTTSATPTKADVDAHEEHAAGGHEGHGHPDSPAASPSGHGAGDGHGHAGEGAKVSDLDQPVEALLSRRCEHDLATFECAECRYEVGVARVTKDMLDDGILRTSRAERRKLEAPLSLTGELRFDERHVTHLAPSTESRVRAVRVSLGQKVRAGEALVELESVAVGEAQSQYLEARAALELARRTVERADSLRKEQIASEKEWLLARQEHEAAEIRARASREKLLRLGLSQAEVEALPARGGTEGRGMLALRAPGAGLVLEMHAVPGELVRPDQSILTVGDLSDLWLWADLYEDQLGRVTGAKGRLRAGVSVKAYPGETFPGTVDFVGPTMDEKTRTVKVRIAVPNPDGKLRAGMFAGVQLYLPGEEQALAVPAAAVLSDEGRTFVFVRHGEQYFIRRPVETGRRSVDWVEVKKGLSGGETIATAGAFLLKSDVLRSKMGAGCAD